MTRLITVARYTHPSLAHISRARLEASGIPVFLANEYTIGANWMYATAVGGVELRVREEDADKARTLLAGHEAEPSREAVMDCGTELPPEATANWDQPEPSCPRCGSTDLHRDTWRLLSFLVTLCFLVPVPVYRNRMRCGQCGHTWTPQPLAETSRRP